MASTHKSLRSGTANKRPTTSIADGQIALNTNTTSPGLFFKDSTGATIIKVGPVHVGTTAPNASPAAGGSSGNSTGEVWLDTSLTPNGVKIWNGASWTNATPIGSTTVQGLLELATNAETQTGTDPDRAVTPAGLQSKVSDSTSTTSSTTIASSTAVKSAYDLANAALPKSGGTVTGNLEIGTTGSLSFEGATADAFETTIAVVDPTADRTITLPDTTGTVVTTGDTGTVTSTMIADGTIVNGDINASAAIAGTKISPDFGSQTVQTTGIFSHALGTAGAPTVTFTGDTNTGIYSPGADQVAISTNGTGRLFVDANGNISIGQSSSALQSGGTGITVFGTTASEIKFLNSTTGASGTDGTALVATTSDFNINNREVGALVFGTSNSARLRIESTGALNFTGAGTAGSTQAVSFNGSAPVNSLVIDSSGRLGIGTSSPSSYDFDGPTALAVANTAGSSTLTIASDASSLGQIAFADGTSSTARYRGLLKYNHLTDGLEIRTAATPAITIDSSQRVGIGTTSPGVKVDIVSDNNTSQTSVLRVNSNNVAVNTALAYDGVTCNSLMYVGTTSANPLVFNINSTERARIDSSGRLLVGTSSSVSVASLESNQQIFGSAPQLSITRGSNNASGATLALAKSRNTAYGSRTIVTDGDTLGSIRFCGDDGVDLDSIGAQIAAQVDGTPGSDDLPSRLVFSTTLDGASSPTERMRINNSGGIYTYGTGTGNSVFQINNTTNTSGAFGLLTVLGSNCNNTSSYHYIAATGGTDKFYVYGNGTYGTASDVNLKKNIETTRDGYLEDLCQLRVVKYNWNDQENSTPKELGLIAQELEAVFPGLVQQGPIKEDGSSYKAIKTSVLTFMLLKALQEAASKIETLEARLSALESA